MPVGGAILANLDSIDLAILDALQDNARISVVDLAKRVNLSPTPCTLRLRRMEQDGVIAGYYARLNPKALGQALLVLVTVSLKATDEATLKAFNTAVRPVYPEPKPVVLVSVIDLSVVPRFLHRAVKPKLEQAYDQAAREIPKGYNPVDYVFLLPDWNGSVTKTFKAKGTDKAAAIVVIDPAGRVTGSYQGPQPGSATLALVSKALNGG